MTNATLERHIKNGRIAASYLVIDSAMRHLHETAVWFASHFNPADVFWLTPKEGAATIQVAETKDFIERAHLAPVGERKLFIVSDASTMTIPAQNKLLKTLEDAPGSTTFILLASSSEPVLHTIKSRCVTVYTKSDSSAPLVPPELAATVKNLFKVKIDDLSVSTKHAIMTASAIVNRNVAANCNQQNQQDLIIMEILKNAKNSQH